MINSKKNLKILEKINISSYDKLNIHSFFSIVYNTIVDNWCFVENSIPTERAFILPNLVGLEVSQFLLKDILKENEIGEIVVAGESVASEKSSDVIDQEDIPLGDKKNSRAQWLERGFYYRRGKYRNLADNSAFRINTYDSPDEVTKELRVKSYIPMYIGVGGTTAEMINSKNVIRLVDDTYEDGSIGKPISTGEAGFNFPSTGDAVSYIYGTSMLTDIGDLARVCKLLRVQTMSFPKLRELNLGHERTRTSVCGIPCEQGPYMEYATKYIKDPVTGEMIVDPDAPLGEPREFRNEILPNLDCSSLSHLTVLDVTNHTNLSELVIDKCTQLQELYARGTIMKSIDLPATTSLKKIYLGEKLTSLSLVDLTGIEEFVVEGLSDCGRLVINNCGDYMAKESYNILNKAIVKLESSYDPITRPSVVSLRGVNWENADQAMLERLLKINADLTGKIVIKGLSNDLKIKLIDKYGNIDDPNNSLYIKYNQSAITKITLPKKLYIYSEGEHPVLFSVTPNNANTYKSATWTLTPISLQQLIQKLV